MKRTEAIFTVATNLLRWVMYLAALVVIPIMFRVHSSPQLSWVQAVLGGLIAAGCVVGPLEMARAVVRRE